MDDSTVIVDYYKQEQSRLAGSYYKGLPIFAHKELHPHVAKQAIDLFDNQCDVLDLAAGSGAFSLRLKDSGFNVVSCDIVKDSFEIEDEISFVSANLNDDFSSKFDSFSAIVALEIIEHLENPRHFLRQCFKLLEPGGKMVLSTPNIDNPRAMLRFIRCGTFRQFTDNDYEISGHITPVSQWQLEKCILEAGFESLSIDSVGAAYNRGFSHIGAKLLNLIATNNRRKKGAIVVASMRKPESPP